MNNFYQILMGIVIGGAMVLPGVSGGVLAVIFGIYDKIMYALNHLFKDFKNSFKTLLPLGIGGVIGVLLFSKVIKFLFESYAVATQYAFMGFVIGGIPALVMNVKKKGGNVNYLATIISFLVIVGLLFIDGNNIINIVGTNNIVDAPLIKVILSGALLAIGIIFPGVSNFQLLMLIGMYHAILNVIAGVPEVLFDMPTLTILIPLGISFLVSVILIIKLYNYMANKHYSLLYSIIIGFVLGAVPVMYPGFSLNLETFIGIGLAVVGFFIAGKIGD